jgi:D-glycero-D-manno-heptose 1,7-bisphosphate phosphatase
VIDGRPDVVLLDRDGTINVKAPDGDYITRPEQVKLLPGAAEAIRILNTISVPIIVVTNQRGIALGRMTEHDLAAVHARLHQLLRQRGAWIDRIFHCPHDNGVCACRKPGTLLLERARNYLGLETLQNSIMIGDSLSDVLAGRAVGARTAVLARQDYAAPREVRVASSLLEAVECRLGLPIVTT